MNYEVGVNGGGDTTTLDNSKEIKSFFDTINDILNERNIAMPLVTERLYKKYIKQSENKEFLENIEQLAVIFNEKKIQNENYFIYLDKFKRALETATFNFEYFTKKGYLYNYQPVMLVKASTPDSTVQRKIPLKVRDALTEKDLPFWLQTGVIELAVENKWI